MILDAKQSPGTPTVYTTVMAPVEDELFDIGAMMAAVRDSKWLIAGALFLALLGGGAYMFLAPPVYETDVVLQVTTENNRGLNSVQDLSGLLGNDTVISDDIEILRSRLILSEAVRSLGHDFIVRPNFFPVIGAAVARRHDAGTPVAAPPFGLDEYAWGGEDLRLVTLEIPEAYLGYPFTLVAGEPVGAVVSDFRLLDDEGRPLLEGVVGQWSEGTLADGNPIKILVSRLQARSGSRFSVTRLPMHESIDALRDNLYIEESGESSGILRVTLRGPNPTMLRDTLDKIAKTYVAYDKERNVAELQRTLQFLESQLPMLKAELEAAEDALNAYRSANGSIDLASESQGVLQRIVMVESQKSELARTRFELIQVYTPSHHKVRAVDAQIGALNRQLEALESQVKKLPGTQQEVLRMSRGAEVNTQLYSVLLNKIQELKIILAGTTGRVHILDDPVLPYEQVEPLVVLAIGGSIAAGLFFGIAGALGRRVLGGDGVVDPQLVETRLGVPICAVIPHSQVQPRLNRSIRRTHGALGVLAAHTPHDLAVESIRGLRTRLDYMLDTTKSKIVLVTGPHPNVGKTFVSVNLATVLAQSGRRVLLIDADLRAGMLQKHFGFEHRAGLSDFLAGDVPLGQLTYGTQIKNLMLLPAGRTPSNPSELLLQPLFSATLRKLSQEYDYVIVDSPPVLGVTDAEIIGRYADAALMVVKAGAHSMRQIEQTAKSLQYSGVELCGTVFNDMDILKKHAEYGQYYGYRSVIPSPEPRHQGVPGLEKQPGQPSPQ